MKESIVNAFESYGILILYVHILGSVLFVGTLFAAQFLFYKPIEAISDEEERDMILLKILKRFFVFSCVVLPTIIFITIIMDTALKIKYGNPIEKAMISIKESIWMLIVLSLMYMYRKYLNAKRAFENNLLIEASGNIIIIIKYLMPLTFILGLIAILFGSIIKGN